MYYDTLDPFVALTGSTVEAVAPERRRHVTAMLEEMDAYQETVLPSQSM